MPDAVSLIAGVGARLLKVAALAVKMGLHIICIIQSQMQLCVQCICELTISPGGHWNTPLAASLILEVWMEFFLETNVVSNFT